MTLQINFERSEVFNNGQGGFLVLVDPERDADYASWPFYTREYDGNRIDTHWTWENPGDPLTEITLSPSLVLKWNEPNTFHIFVRNGGIEHCGDCQCGCQE